MAVAAPVLERRTATEERTSRVYNAAPITDEEHNSRIRQNYARLINPENKIDAALDRAPVEAVETPVAEERKISYAQPAFVENARADADIFHAHSEINLRLAAQQKLSAEMSSDEEEDEDLRPTLTTIQYKTTGVKNSVEEGKIENTGVEKRAGLSKRDKIIIASIVGVILVMLILVIVNSAVLSNINGDVSSLQSSLATLKGSYEGVKDEINPWLALTEEDIANIAKELGWIHA